MSMGVEELHTMNILILSYPKVQSMSNSNSIIYLQSKEQY